MPRRSPSYPRPVPIALWAQRASFPKAQRGDRQRRPGSDFMRHKSEACGQKLLPRVSEVWVSGPRNPTAGLVTATGKARTSFEPPPTLMENQERRDVCMLSCFSSVQLFVILWTVACQAPWSMGFSGQEYWSGLLCPSSRGSSYPEIEPTSLCLLHWQVDSLPLSHQGSLKSTNYFK